MITMTVTGRRICWSGDGDPVTTGSVGYPVVFNFDTAWDDLAKVAVFRGSGEEQQRELSEDATTIPPEVLTVPGSILWIGVRGENGDGTLVIPTVWARIGYLPEGVGDTEIPERQLPPGGTTGQVLTKQSDEDYDADWQDPQGGGGSGPSPYESDPAALGTASPGSSDAYARGDHVHPKPSAADLGAYVKPAAGIPASDLAAGVQTSLGKADSALQSVPSTYRTAAAQDTIDAGKLNANQGSGNAGKWLKVDSDGSVIAASLPLYNGGVT